MGRRLCSVLVLGALLTTSLAFAHKIPVQRKVMVTVKPAPSGVEVDALVWMRLGGLRAQRFVSRFDLDQDGKFNTLEAKQIADALGPEAIGGLYLALDGQTLTPSSADSKARLIAPRTIEVAILLSYAMRPLGEGRFRLATHAGRGRAGTHPHFAEVSVFPPLAIRTEAGLVTRIGARKLTHKRPMKIHVQATSRPGPGE